MFFACFVSAIIYFSMKSINEPLWKNSVAFFFSPVNYEHFMRSTLLFEKYSPQIYVHHHCKQNCSYITVYYDQQLIQLSTNAKLIPTNRLSNTLAIHSQSTFVHTNFKHLSGNCIHVNGFKWTNTRAIAINNFV